MFLFLSGLNPEAYIRRELHNNRVTKKNLNNEFWQEFELEFALSPLRFADLVTDDSPAGMEPKTVSDELLTKIGFAHHVNPAMKSPQPLINYLEYAPKMAVDALVFVLVHCRESVHVTKAHSRVLMMALAKYIGKWDIHLELPSLWARIKDDMDSTVTEVIATKPPAERMRWEYIAGIGTALKPLLNLDSAKLIEQVAWGFTYGCAIIVLGLHSHMLLFNMFVCMACLSASVPHRLWTMAMIHQRMHCGMSTHRRQAGCCGRPRVCASDTRSMLRTSWLASASWRNTVSPPQISMHSSR